jgi:hypothetical protein
MVIRLLLILAACFVLFLIISYCNRSSTNDKYTDPDPRGASKALAFATSASTAAVSAVQPTAPPSIGYGAVGPSAVAPVVDVPRPFENPADEIYRPVEHGKGPTEPKATFPKDRLQVEDLLPHDAANTAWAQANPAGQGDIKDQNFLTAGFHVGINTVGQSLRNANHQLRSEPPNPQIKVSPWNQSTIEPDVNRRPIEIGSPGSAP